MVFYKCPGQVANILDLFNQEYVIFPFRIVRELNTQWQLALEPRNPSYDATVLTMLV